jgi:hypothetical protein
MGSTTSAPPGTVLNQAPVWFDNTVTITSTGGALVANGPVTYNGTVSVAGTSLNSTIDAVTPASAGLTAWDFPYAFATGTGSAVTTAGLLYLAKIPLTAGTVVNNLWFRIATAASGITTAQNFGGLYNSSGQLVATSADLSTVIGTNTGPIQAALTSAYTVTNGGDYWAGFFFNAGTTLPVLGCFVNNVTVTTSVAFLGSTTAFGNTAATFPFSVSATTGNTTALPTSITMSSNTATGAYAYWVGID